MAGNKGFLALLFLIALGGVFADNVTISQSGNVTIVCNNMSQCAGTAPGILPFFFTALDTNTTIPVVLTSSYEQNITLVQNVTFNITQNNQTVEITTQNITVITCNETPNTEAISNAVTSSLTAQLQTSLVNSCTSACKPGDDERNNLMNQKADMERQYRECVVMAQAASNISTTNYEHLNLTMTQKVDDLESQQVLTYVIFFIGMIFLIGAAAIVFRKGVLRNYIKGRAKRTTPNGPGVDE